MTLDYIALAILIAVVLILFYGIIMIHDIPYEIAKKRNHPHQDAIHYAGWVSLFTLHVLWPLLCAVDLGHAVARRPRLGNAAVKDRPARFTSASGCDAGGIKPSEK